MSRSSYVMLAELDTPFKVNKFIYAIDLFIVIGFAAFGLLTQDFVFSDLKIPYIIFNLLVGVFMTFPSMWTNPGKRNFQTLGIVLHHLSNRRTYHALPVEPSAADIIKPSYEYDIAQMIKDRKEGQK